MPLSGTALGIVGFLAVFIVLVLVIGRYLYVIPTLTIAPVLAALLAGFSFTQIGNFVVTGLEGIVPITAMFAFAVWYFSIMRERGLFDPFIKRIIGTIIDRPILLTTGTVLLTMVTHFDGTGATTFLITIPAMLPLYEALNVDRRILAALAGMTAGTMNLLPWGGQVVRGVSAIDSATITNLFNPMIPSMVAGVGTIILIGGFYSRNIDSEIESLTSFEGVSKDSLLDDALDGRDPTTDRIWWANFLLTLLVLGSLIAGVTTPELAFMIGLVFALVINVRDYDNQKEVLESYSSDVMTYVGILLSAGVLIGVLNESGMITEMANILVLLLPEALGQNLTLIVGVFAMPVRLLFSPDAFFFGVLPVLAETGTQYGFTPVEITRASLPGQTTGFPISPFTGATFLLIGLANVELGEHIKFTFLPMWLVSLVSLAVAFLVGAIPL